jgi:integrase
VAYRHGLRAVEICDLEWSQVEFDRAATLHVRRAKNGKPAAHPIRGDEIRPREYLTPSEVETLIRTARQGRYGHRDTLAARQFCDIPNSWQSQYGISQKKEAAEDLKRRVVVRG